MWRIKIIFFINFISFIVLLESCTITKRRYRKGVYVSQNSSLDKIESNDPNEIRIETNDTIHHKIIKQKKTGSTIKRESDGFYYGLGIGLGNNYSIPLTGEWNIRGFGFYGDYVGISKAPYYSIGFFYDCLKKRNNNSLKIGISIFGNPKISYEYLFTKGKNNYYIGANLLYVPNIDITGIPDGADPAKFNTINGSFVPFNIVLGIKIVK